MPQVIIIDEIGTEFEVLAARTIAEKGVQLVGTTHGNCLENVIKNPPLTDLIGGIQHVTLSDEEAKRRGTQKIILERKSYPTFEIIIEINSQNSWTIHEDVNNSVDLFLRKNSIIRQIRQFSSIEKIKIKCQKALIFQNSFINNSNIYLSDNNWILLNKINYLQFTNTKLSSKKLIIYSYSLSNNLLKEVLLKMGLKFILTNEIQKASLIIGLKKHFKQNFKLISLAKQERIPIYVLNQISFYQLTKFVQLINLF